MRREERVGLSGAKSWVWIAESIISEIPHLFTEAGSARVITGDTDGLVAVKINLHHPVQVTDPRSDHRRGIVVDMTRQLCRVPGMGDTVYVAPVPRQGDKTVTIHLSLKRATKDESQAVTLEEIRTQLITLARLITQGFCYNERRVEARLQLSFPGS